MSGLSLKKIWQTTSPEALLLLVVFLGFLWATLINILRVEWTVNPQYGYGWAVPFLCVYLNWKNFASTTEIQHEKCALSKFSKPLTYALAAVLALLYAPTHLIAVATPEWRLVSWALALEVVGLTLLLVDFVLGEVWLRRLAFPLAFFLVAVPWPTVMEGPLIQGLTRADASATVELLGWFGIPAMPHGNVIEVATGQVGIDEACSGIRSFQATLMISLFLGELYRLNFPRRLGLVLGGFAMSFFFNLARMSVLVSVAAYHGVSAIAKWHDPTGVSILLACFFALWALGIFLSSKQKSVPSPPSAIGPTDFSEPKPQPIPLLLALIAWFALVGILVEGWYRWHEMRLPTAIQWTVSWPTNNPTFKNVLLSETTRQFLRYDEARSVAWEENGIAWQVVFLHWNPGRTALHLAQNHTPEVCMTAAGHNLTIIAERSWFEVAGLRLPFIIYSVENSPKPFYVFYCLWDDRTSAEGRSTMHLNSFTRLAPVLAGLRNPGQRSLEIAMTGAFDEAQAETLFKNELQKIIQSRSENSNGGD